MSNTSDILTPESAKTSPTKRPFDLPAKELVLCYEKDLQEVAATCECADERRLLKKAAGAMGRVRRGHKARRVRGGGK
jgi:hypothetical protein